MQHIHDRNWAYSGLRWNNKALISTPKNLHTYDVKTGMNFCSIFFTKNYQNLVKYFIRVCSYVVIFARSALVQEMASHRLGTKPLFEAIMAKTYDTPSLH